MRFERHPDSSGLVLSECHWIDATDKQIDKLVYEFYELTEEVPRRYAPGIVPLTLRAALRLLSTSVTKIAIVEGQ